VATGSSRKVEEVKEEMVGELAKDIETLGRDFDPGSNPRTERITTAICFNKGCEDYGVERDKNKACECKRQRTPVKGAGSSPGWY
jgi:hypothetical protein